VSAVSSHWFQRGGRCRALRAKEQGLHQLHDAVALLGRKATPEELEDYKRFVVNLAETSPTLTGRAERAPAPPNKPPSKRSQRASARRLRKSNRSRLSGSRSRTPGAGVPCGRNARYKLHGDVPDNGRAAFRVRGASADVSLGDDPSGCATAFAARQRLHNACRIGGSCRVSAKTRQVSSSYCQPSG
jgi:hypothetical protein